MGNYQLQPKLEPGSHPFLQEIVTNCTQLEATDRPTFSELFQQISSQFKIERKGTKNKSELSLESTNVTNVTSPESHFSGENYISIGKNNENPNKTEWKVRADKTYLEENRIPQQKESNASQLMGTDSYSQMPLITQSSLKSENPVTEMEQESEEPHSHYASVIQIHLK